MAVKGLFFDSVGGDRVYNASDHDDLIKRIRDNGYLRGFGNELEVIPASPEAMEVQVSAGSAVAEGKMVINDAALTLAISDNTSGSTRRDRIVVRVNYTDRQAEILVKEGDTSGNPPPVDQGTPYELGLATIEVIDGAVQISSGDITDTRDDESVCGASEVDPGIHGNERHTPNFTTQADVNSLIQTALPEGVITAWSGAPTNVPSGWTLCDGTNGAPDLRDRFIVSTGSKYASGDMGGADEVTLATSQMPSHSHSQGATGSDSHSHTVNSHDHGAGSLSTGTGGSHDHALAVWETDGNRPETLRTGPLDNTLKRDAINNDGAHTHSISGSTGSTSPGTNSDSHTHTNPNTNATGGGNAHENRPPYYALAFIMKIY